MEYVFRILNHALRYNDGNINSDDRFEKMEFDIKLPTLEVSSCQKT